MKSDGTGRFEGTRIRSLELFLKIFLLGHGGRVVLDEDVLAWAWRSSCSSGFFCVGMEVELFFKIFLRAHGGRVVILDAITSNDVFRVSVFSDLNHIFEWRAP